VGVSLVATVAYGVAGTVAHANELATVPDATVATAETGEVDGAIVAVGLPPVPDTSVVVEVGPPPVPDTSVVVEVGPPPVPPVTVPDAEPPVTTPAVDQSAQLPDVAQSVEPLLPETGADEARATAIVAGAAMSIGAALRALARR
jgi:hypothetical protein